MATVVFAPEATPSVYSVASSKPTIASQHDLQGMEVTDIERSEFLRHGYCPFHPDIQLKKRRRWTRRWKTVLRECPRCAADFLIRQLALTQPAGSIAGTAPIPVAVVERPGSFYSETSSICSLSHRRSDTNSKSIPHQQHSTSLLPQRSASNTTSSTSDNPSLFSRQAKHLYSPEALRRDDSNVEEKQQQQPRQLGPCSVVPMAASPAFWKSKSLSFRSDGPEESSLITKSSSWNPFAANRRSSSIKGSDTFLTPDEPTDVRKSLQANAQPWKKFVFPQAAHNGGAMEPSQQEKALLDSNNNTERIGAAGVMGAAVVAAVVGVRDSVEESREGPAQTASRATELAVSSDSATFDLTAQQSYCIAESDDGSSIAVEVISTHEDPSVIAASLSWTPFAQESENSDVIRLRSSRSSAEDNNGREEITTELVVGSGSATDKKSFGVESDEGSSSAIEVTSAAAESSSSGSTEGTSRPQLDPVFEPMLKKTYSQVEILEREAATQNEINSVVAEEPEQEVFNGEPITSGEVRKEGLSGGCMMFDCMLSMDSFGCGGGGGGCEKNKTEQLLDAVPSADRDVNSCTGIDSVC